MPSCGEQGEQTNSSAQEPHSFVLPSRLYRLSLVYTVSSGPHFSKDTQMPNFLVHDSEGEWWYQPNIVDFLHHLISPSNKEHENITFSVCQHKRKQTFHPFNYPAWCLYHYSQTCFRNNSCDLFCQHGVPCIATQPSVAAQCQDNTSITAPTLCFHLTDIYLNNMNSAWISFKIKIKAIVRLSTGFIDCSGGI